MSLFNLENQNESIDNKIVAGLERISQVFKILLWEKAKNFGLSPIQIQVLIFIQYHTPEKSTISYLAKEFNVTKATLSDVIKSLEQKKLIEKKSDTVDTRSYTVALTIEGLKLVQETEDYADPLVKNIASFTEENKVVIWDSISTIIRQCSQAGIISVQRTCYNCQHYSYNNQIHFCKLLNSPLEIENIRIDCPEFLTFKKS